MLLAAGAWSAEVYARLLPRSKPLPISSLAGHSLVVRSPYWPLSPRHQTTTMDKKTRTPVQEPEDCHAILTTDAALGYSPELFSRMPDGHVYLAGLNSPAYPLPEVASQRNVDAESIATLKRTARRLLGDDIEVVREGVCWRPVTKRGLPLITDMICRGHRNLFIAAGHGAWGISLSLGTGWCVARSMQGQDMSRYLHELGV